MLISKRIHVPFKNSDRKLKRPNVTFQVSFRPKFPSKDSSMVSISKRTSHEPALKNSALTCSRRHSIQWLKYLKMLKWRRVKLMRLFLSVDLLVSQKCSNWWKSSLMERSRIEVLILTKQLLMELLSKEESSVVNMIKKWIKLFLSMWLHYHLELRLLVTRWLILSSVVLSFPRRNLRLSQLIKITKLKSTLVSMKEGVPWQHIITNLVSLI